VRHLSLIMLLLPCLLLAQRALAPAAATSPVHNWTQWCPERPVISCAMLRGQGA